MMRKKINMKLGSQEEKQSNGQCLKSIKFKLPIIEEDMNICLDNDKQTETVVLMSGVKDWYELRPGDIYGFLEIG